MRKGPRFRPSITGSGSPGACSGAPAAGPDTSPTPTASADAAPAKARSGKIEEFPSQGGNARAYFVAPATPEKHPAILVIQEWWGLNDWIEDNADRFAGQGFVAAAVDLYRGKATGDPDVAHELMRGLDQDRGMADLQATLDRLNEAAAREAWSRIDAFFQARLKGGS